MSNDNLKFWDQFADIDPQFTKPITGKDYKGTSPNAHYVIKCLTEMFGPVGEGFGWRVLVEGIERFGDTAIHWCRIEFWHSNPSNTFESYGQTKMAYMTRGQSPYLKVDEDAPKKSLTDAVTKAAAQVGVAANIFLGRWDDSKYVSEVNAQYREEETPSFNSAGARDRLLTGIAKRKTKQDLTEYWKAEKETLSLISEPHFNEVKAAFAKAGETAIDDPAMQAPSDMAAE